MPFPINPPYLPISEEPTLPKSYCTYEEPTCTWPCFYFAVYASKVYGEYDRCKELLKGVNVTIITTRLFGEIVTEKLVTDDKGRAVSDMLNLYIIGYLSRQTFVQKDGLDFGSGIGQTHELKDPEDSISFLGDYGTKLLAKVRVD